MSGRLCARFADSLQPDQQRCKVHAQGGRIVVRAREGDEIVFRCVIRALAYRRNSSPTSSNRLPRSTVRLPFARRTRIGLTLVRRVVEVQGGGGSAKSEGRNRGSEFTVRLPVADATDPNVTSAPMGEPPSPAGLRVLVVDDNRDVADSTAERHADETRCDVHVTYDAGGDRIGASASARCSLLDIGLPTIDGYSSPSTSVHSPKRSNDDRRGVGYGQEQDRVRSKSMGSITTWLSPSIPTVLAGRVGSLPSCRATVLATKRTFRCEHGRLTASRPAFGPCHLGPFAVPRCAPAISANLAERALRAPRAALDRRQLRIAPAV